MSEENVELVRHSLEAFARGDFETAFSSYRADVEWVPSADEPDLRPYHGLAGVRDFVASAAEPWVDRFESRMTFEDFIDCGDWVVVPWTAQLHGRGSGIPMEVRETYAVCVKDMEVVRVEEYRTRELALDAIRPR